MLPRPRIRQVAALAVAMVLALALASQDVPSGGPNTASPVSAVSSVAPQTNQMRVVAISLDGLNPRAILELGPRGVPYLFRLYGQGAGTINARTQVEQTVTLPNHTSMVTGRRMDRVAGGHGVTWNSHVPWTTVQWAARHDVSSVFETVDLAGGSTSMFSTKTKFSIFTRSWPAAIDRSVIAPGDDSGLTMQFRRDLVATPRAFAFLHLGLADQVGHDQGWMSPAYLTAVRRLDQLVGSVMNVITAAPWLRSSTVLILTSDHGGIPGTRSHSNAARLENIRVPFVVWGAGVRPGDIYALNRHLIYPGNSRIGFTGRQPIRNGDLANLSTDILGLGPVPGSLWNATQQLTWH